MKKYQFLTEEQYTKIKRLLASGKYSHRGIAKIMKRSTSTVSAVRNSTDFGNFRKRGRKKTPVTEDEFKKMKRLQGAGLVASKIRKITGRTQWPVQSAMASKTFEEYKQKMATHNALARRRRQTKTPSEDYLARG